MLQEEGFVEADLNQRMRMAGMDPSAVDADYAMRITLECLVLAMTVDGFGARAKREGKAQLTAIRRAVRAKDVEGWFAAHREYHRLLTAGAGETVRHQLEALPDRSVRYIHLTQRLDSDTWSEAGEAEHPAILEAVIAGDRDALVSAWLPGADRAEGAPGAGTGLRAAGRAQGDGSGRCRSVALGSQLTSAQPSVTAVRAARWKEPRPARPCRGAGRLRGRVPPLRGRPVRAAGGHRTGRESGFRGCAGDGTYRFQRVSSVDR